MSDASVAVRVIGLTQTGKPETAERRRIIAFFDVNSLTCSVCAAWPWSVLVTPSPSHRPGRVTHAGGSSSPASNSRTRYGAKLSRHT